MKSEKHSVRAERHATVQGTSLGSVSNVTEGADLPTTNDPYSITASITTDATGSFAIASMFVNAAGTANGGNGTYAFRVRCLLPLLIQRYDLQIFYPFGPPDDALIRRDERQSAIHCGGNDQSICWVSMKIHQLSAQYSRIWMQWLQNCGCLQVFTHPCFNIRLQLKASFGNQHRNFPNRDRRNVGQSPVLVQGLRTGITGCRPYPCVCIEHRRFQLVNSGHPTPHRFSSNHHE